VQVGPRTQALALRLVGVHTPQGYGVFLTHLPPRIGPRQVAALSRGRWEVELRLTLDTSVHRLDAIDAARPGSLKALLQASRIASMLAARLAHTHPRQTRPQQAGAPRTEAPLHPRRLALQLAVSLSVHRASLRPAGGRGPAALGQDGRAAHARGQRSSVAPSAIHRRAAPRLETPAPCAQKGQQQGCQERSFNGSSLSEHI
jgi:hypothetical protein